MRRSPLFSDTDFIERVEASNLSIGDVVEGQVLDVSTTQAFVDIFGLNSIIQKKDCSWQSVRDCQDILSDRERRKFLLLAVNKEKGHLLLSLRFPDTDPWQQTDLPHKGQKIEVKVTSCDRINYHCHTLNGIEAVLAKSEISWTDRIDPTDSSLIEEQLNLVIIDRDDDERVLKGSIRQLEEDPWPLIHKRFPKGTQMRGTVAEIMPSYVRVDLPDGYQGILYDSALRRAGFELADFTQTLVKGQGLDVVVTKVFISKRRIRLDLMRNV